MPTAPCVLRTLDPAERYSWLLGHVANMNLVVPLRGQVDVVDGEPVRVEATGEIPLSVMPAPDDLAGAVGAMLNRPLDPDPSPLARCVHLRGEGEERSVVALIVHHALVDARGVCVRRRRTGVSVTGAIAAPVLQAGAALFGDSEDHTICLAIPTDLRARVEPPIADDDVVLAIGLLCTRISSRTRQPTRWQRDIGEQITQEVARGESHPRAGAFAPSDAGIESFST